MMNVVDVNIWMVLLAALAYFGIGAVWYMPQLFGAVWLRELGKEIGGADPKMFAVSFVLELLAVYVLAHFIDYAAALGWVEGAMVGFWVGFGFVLTTMGVNALYAGRTLKLTLIDGGYHLVGLMVAGAILAV